MLLPETLRGKSDLTAADENGRPTTETQAELLRIPVWPKRLRKPVRHQRAGDVKWVHPYHFPRTIYARRFRPMTQKTPAPQFLRRRSA